MGLIVCGGAALKCTFGTGPSLLNVLPASRVMTTQAFATIMDQITMVNIPSFGFCRNPLNPAVASATSAALGVLTPAPCVPLPVGSWVPGCPNVLIGGKPALTQDSRLLCAYGGIITISSPGNTTVLTGGG